MKKRVLHIISSKHWRGGEQLVNAMFNSSSDEFDSYLFCPEDAELVKRNPKKFESIFTYKKRFGFDVFAAHKLKKITKENQIDLIHLHDSHAINTYILADLFGMNIHAVIHRHVNFPVFSKWKYQHKKIQKIICVSEAVKKTMSFITDEQKLSVIHPSINLQKFNSQQKGEELRKEINIPLDKKIIGIVSALEKEKNIDEFLKISEEYNTINPEDQFVIIGEGSLLNSFKTQYTLPNIHFMGFRNNIHELLPEFDLFLFTSGNEGFPLVLLEAMASKVPILSSNFPAVNELLQNGKNGYIYNNISEALQKIELLNTATKQRITLVENAFRFVQQFDITLMNQQIAAIYKSILKDD